VDTAPAKEPGLGGNILLATLKTYRIEIKYILITLALLAGLYWLARQDYLGGFETFMQRLIDDMSELGMIGVFIIALISNSSLLIQVPYTLPMLSVALYSDSLIDLVWLGVATGTGAGLGEIVSYAIAYNIAAQIEALSKSALFRWIREKIDRHPRSIPIFVFIGAAFPIPDDLIIMPLAVVNYPIRKLLIPMFTGKILHNIAVAFLFHYATDRFAGLADRDIDVDLSIVVLILFVVIIAYQIDKARSTLSNGSQDEATIPANEPTD
jgi:membrane protein YqaA with SNARE-associated domain